MKGVSERWLGGWLHGLGRFGLFTKDVLGSALWHWPRGHDLVAQVHFIGVKSQAVVLIKAPRCLIP